MSKPLGKLEGNKSVHIVMSAIVCVTQRHALVVTRSLVEPHYLKKEGGHL